MMTTACDKVLKRMLAAEEADLLEDAEIVCDGNSCWVGDMQIRKETVTRLLQLCLVRSEDMGGCEHYTLNEEGRAMAKDTNYRPQILNQVEVRDAFKVTAQQNTTPEQP
ncbi:hypothetical protein [Polaromonas sp.]|uniref:hypothetical protein n=1 Tax=Polaromonas sp. TaxID=1869339 RepID=UPI00352B652D